MTYWKFVKLPSFVWWILFTVFVSSYLSNLFLLFFIFPWRKCKFCYQFSYWVRTHVICHDPFFVENRSYFVRNVWIVHELTTRRQKVIFSWASSFVVEIHRLLLSISIELRISNISTSWLQPVVVFFIAIKLCAICSHEHDSNLKITSNDCDGKLSKTSQYIHEPYTTLVRKSNFSWRNKQMFVQWPDLLQCCLRKNANVVCV